MLACDAISSLTHWLATSQGAFVGPIRSETRNGLRGLFVSEACAAGDPLCAIPQGCTLQARASDGLKANERLMLELLAARSSGSHSLYLATTPSHIPLLRDWTKPQLARLQSPRLAAAVRSQRAWVERTFARVRPFAEQVGEGRTEDLEWAERVVRSRALSSVGPDGRTSLQLVPLFDLCNHRSPAPSRAPAPLPHVMQTADGMVVLCAATALSAGDEVTFAYRDEGNAELLLDYGFAVPSPLDSGGVERLHVPLPHSLLQMGGAGGVGEEGGATDELTLGSAALDATAVRRVRRLLRLAPSVIAEQQPGSPTQPHETAAAAATAAVVAVARDALRLESAACGVLREACVAALRAMPTSEEEDAALLHRLEASGPGDEAEADGGGGGGGDDDDARALAALHFRIGQKARLRLAADALDAEQARLAAHQQRQLSQLLWWAARRPRLARRTVAQPRLLRWRRADQPGRPAIAADHLGLTVGIEGALRRSRRGEA